MINVTVNDRCAPKYELDYKATNSEPTNATTALSVAKCHRQRLQRVERYPSRPSARILTKSCPGRLSTLAKASMWAGPVKARRDWNCQLAGPSGPEVILFNTIQYKHQSIGGFLRFVLSLLLRPVNKGGVDEGKSTSPGGFMDSSLGPSRAWARAL